MVQAAPQATKMAPTLFCGGTSSHKSHTKEVCFRAMGRKAVFP